MDATPSEPEPALLFHWKAPKTFFSIRLLAASVAAIVIHGFCFYIFQVEEPTARRTLPQTHEILMLSLDARSAALLPQAEESDPTSSVKGKTATLLRQIEDYYAGFEGTLNPRSPLQISLDALPEPRLDAAPAPEIRPLYDGFRPVEPEIEEDGATRLAFLPENKPYEPAPARHLPGPSFVLSPGLEQRGWQNGVPRVDLKDPAAVAPPSGQIAWRVAVTPSGRVEFVFPLRVRESPQLDEVASQLRRSRFQARPETETELQWGTISLQW